LGEGSELGQGRGSDTASPQPPALCLPPASALRHAAPGAGGTCLGAPCRAPGARVAAGRTQAGGLLTAQGLLTGTGTGVRAVGALGL